MVCKARDVDVQKATNLVYKKTYKEWRLHDLQLQRRVLAAPPRKRQYRSNTTGPQKRAKHAKDIIPDACDPKNNTARGLDLEEGQLEEDPEYCAIGRVSQKTIREKMLKDLIYPGPKDIDVTYLRHMQEIVDFDSSQSGVLGVISRCRVPFNAMKDNPLVGRVLRTNLTTEVLDAVSNLLHNTSEEVKDIFLLIKQLAAQLAEKNVCRTLGSLADYFVNGTKARYGVIDPIDQIEADKVADKVAEYETDSNDNDSNASGSTTDTKEQATTDADAGKPVTDSTEPGVNPSTTTTNTGTQNDDAKAKATITATEDTEIPIDDADDSDLATLTLSAADYDP
ncbi:hypothetical protein NUU61_006866 [Penicillium alfredii]|uniref:Uncharacterized protein n=1 Tax=Penicillium alfredii TaxID=1506179 RepID=A0A9W9K466_9EURO|nr:uncharacterized protein NUU61_006866 [Penicillium alfredii]KAJ5091996.1 hypothetical protein NUU61_006866 [Penicillium alfredii]